MRVVQRALSVEATSISQRIWKYGITFPRPPFPRFGGRNVPSEEVGTAIRTKCSFPFLAPSTSTTRTSFHSNLIPFAPLPASILSSTPQEQTQTSLRHQHQHPPSRIVVPSVKRQSLRDSTLPPGSSQCKHRDYQEFSDLFMYKGSSCVDSVCVHVTRDIDAPIQEVLHAQSIVTSCCVELFEGLFFFSSHHLLLTSLSPHIQMRRRRPRYGTELSRGRGETKVS
jgi:hypothetical protein